MAAPAAAPTDYVVGQETVVSLETKDVEDGSNSDDEYTPKAKQLLDYSTPEADEAYDPEHFDPTLYEQPPIWYKQFTYRSGATVVVLSFLLGFITLKGTLQTGNGVPYSIPSGLLTYLLIQVFTKLAGKVGLQQMPFTRQENTAVQTAIVAAVAILGEAGFGSSLFGLTKVTYIAVGGDGVPGNRIQDTMPLNLRHVLPFLPILAFAGPFILISLRKVIVIDLDLPWPSGTVVGILLNSIHGIGKKGAVNARRQVRSMLEWSLATFLWCIFRWFSSGQGADCGYEYTPFFGLKAKEYGWYYDFRTQYIGSGFIVPYPVSYSMMVGGIISYGILWPILTPKIGDWYPISTYGDSTFAGLYGYQVCMAISLVLGDCVYQLGKVVYVSIGRIKIYRAARAARLASGQTSMDPGDVRPISNYDPVAAAADRNAMRVLVETRLERRVRQYYFYKDNIPGWIGVVAYSSLTVVYSIVMPLVYPQVKWYYVLPVMVMAIPFAFANAYSSGLTNYSITTSLAKVVIFSFARSVGEEKGGVVVGLLCGLLMSATVSNAVEMCQDFRTGYLTCSSAKAMMSAQLFGALVGCFTAPCVFYIFYNAYPIGVVGSAWPNPYAAIYRNIALLGLTGFDVLPKYCVLMCIVAFFTGIGMDAVRDLTPSKYRRYIPYPIAMGLVFYLGVYLGIDYSIGAVAKFLWGLKDPAGQALLYPAVATGLIVGDGLGSFPTAIISLLGYQAPMCIQWIPSNPDNWAFPNGY